MFKKRLPIKINPPIIYNPIPQAIPEPIPEPRRKPKFYQK